MACFNLDATIKNSLTPLNKEDFLNKENWQQNNNQLSNALRLRGPEIDVNKDAYKPNIAMRITGFVIALLLLVVIIATSLMSCASSGMVFSGVGLLYAFIPLALVAGSAGIIYRLTKKIDVFAGGKIQFFKMGRCERVLTTLALSESENVKIENMEVNIGPESLESYIDKSTLDQDGNGLASIYSFPRPMVNRAGLFLLLWIGAALSAIGRMVYNTIRMFIAPFYIIFRMILQVFCPKEGAKQEDLFIPPDIIRETARSIVEVLKAPFYATALMMSLLYGYFSPLDGRILFSAVERDWNGDVAKSRSVWLVVPTRNFLCEGNGSRTGLGQQAHYLAGCMQPIGVALYENGVIQKVVAPSVQAYKDCDRYLLVPSLAENQDIIDVSLGVGGKVS